MAPPVRVPDDLLAAIYAHARDVFPDECCGYLRGGPELELVRCRNAQADGEHPTHPDRGADTGFVIAGRELFELARTLSTDRPAVLVYHSHTNGRAYFSSVDRANALGDGAPAYPVQHLVVGVTTASDGTPQVTDAAIYAWNAEAGEFEEVARFAAGC